MRPILFRVFGIPVHAYGFFLAVAFWIGTLITEREAKKKGIHPDRAIDLALLSILTALIGARLGFVLLSSGYFLEHPFEVFYVTSGGLSFHGGLILAVVSGIVFCRRHGISPWKMADIVAPQVALGTAITRIGCFLNGCCYGIVSDVPWALRCSEVDPFLRHPAQLYAVGLNFLLFLYLWRRRNHGRFDSYLAWQYLIGYSVIRFVLEFWRESEYLFGWLKVAQAASLLIIVMSLIAVHFLSRRCSSKK